MIRYYLILICLGMIGQSCAPEKRPVIMGKELGDGLYALIYTNKGNILTTLDYEKVPLTVASFVGLCEGSTLKEEKYKGKCFYDGILWHRVVPGFVIQGGDPNTLPGGNKAMIGMGGPGYQFKQEVRADMGHNSPGTLAMANSGPNTNGSQFYITHVPTPQLDGGYNVFGYTLRGMETVNAIVQNDTIKTVKIIRVGSEAKNFDEKTILSEFVDL